jgi:hypothetical protein
MFAECRGKFYLSDLEVKKAGCLIQVHGPCFLTVTKIQYIHRRPQPHVQKLLGPVEIPLYEEWHARAPLGIPQQTIKDSPDNSHLEQSERRADRTTWWTLRR